MQQSKCLKSKPAKAKLNAEDQRGRNITFCHVFTMTENRLTISGPGPEVNFKPYEFVFKHVLMNVVQDKRS